MKMDKNTAWALLQAEAELDAVENSEKASPDFIEHRVKSLARIRQTALNELLHERAEQVVHKELNRKA